MKKSGRRSFLKKVGVGGVSAAILPATLLDDEAKAGIPPRYQKFKTKTSKAAREYNGVYKDDYLKRLGFPLGGMGTGMFCIEGCGAISHMSLRSKPDVFNEPGMFGAVSLKGINNGAKIAEGPVPDYKSFGQPLTGNGAGGSIFGLPRFENASFIARFPFGTLSLDEEDYPLTMEITAWNPFIPTDADNSSLPVASLEYNIPFQSHTCLLPLRPPHA